MNNEIFNQKKYKLRRQTLKNTPTEPERKLWAKRKNSQFHEYTFRRQHGIDPYIVDFYCTELKLVIEIDGNTHFINSAKAYD